MRVVRLWCTLFGHRFEWDETQDWKEFLVAGITCRRCGHAPGKRAADAKLAKNQEPRS